MPWSGVVGGGVEGGQEGLRGWKAAVDYVDVVDVGTAQEERQPDVPVGLLPGSEDCYVVGLGASSEDESRGQGGAEGG